MMSRIWVGAFGLWLSAVLGSPPAAQEAEPPRTIAFVVGIQNYDDPDLDKLQYTVRDAQDVFERLKAVTNLDLDRSRLLLADPDAPDEANLNDPDWMVRKSRLGLQEMQDELASFLETIEDDDTVTFYFGGHGTVQADRHLLLLPSDYSRRPQKRFWRYSNIIDDIRGRIDDRNLRNVRVVFFANMCGAGTAAGDMNADEDLNEDLVKEWLASHTLGFERFAFFPASAPNQNTFESEDFGRSIFAHYLIEGLRGAAAKDGVITAQSLFSYLDARIPDDLPRDPEAFDPTISIGVTREIEARTHYLNGLALLSSALETDDPLFWRLAERDLAAALNFSGGGRLGALAALRLAQVRAASGKDPAQVIDILAPVANSAVIDLEFRAAVETMLEAAERGAGEPFVALLVTSSWSNGSRHIMDMDEEAREAWREFLQGLPGHLATELIELNLSGEERERRQQLLKTMIEIKAARQDAAGPPHLVLVYSGVVDPEKSFPFSIAGYVAFLKQWGGEVTLIYDAPFGGFLKEAYDQDLLGDISLVLAAREKNGMTFYGDQSVKSSAHLLTEMLRIGVVDVESWEPFQRYREEYSSTLQHAPEGSSWVVGTPVALMARDATSPVFSEAAELRRQAEASLAPVRRLASLIATGCDLSLECEGFAPGTVETSVEVDGVTVALGLLAAEEGVGQEAVYDLLKRAALLDFSGNLTDAFDLYQRFLVIHEEVHREVRDGAPAEEDTLRAEARQSLERLAEQVRDRVDGLQGKMARRVRLLLASVPDYASPLVPDLVGVGADVGTWETAINESGIWRSLGMDETETPVEVSRLDVSSRGRFLATLDENLEQTDQQDLVIFVFSGRGIEIGGERYLALSDAFSGIGAGALPSSRLDPGQETNGTVLESLLQPWRESRPGAEGWVSLTEVAERARDRWFLGIYDAQFTPPIFDPTRADSVLDKHLNSVRPSPPETPGAVRTASDLERFVAGPSEFLGKHIHIWWEGRLTERPTPSSDCPIELRGVRSPMSATLLAVLLEQPHGTYRDWVDRAQEHACLGPSTEFGLVAQGFVDLPRFASGNAATQIPFFLGSGERRDVNLQLSEHVTASALESGDHPLFGLSHAGILVARAEFARSMECAPRLGQLGRLAIDRGGVF